MSDALDQPKGYRFPNVVIRHAVYLSHRYTLSHRDVQEPMFERGVDVSHETVRQWCSRFGPDIAEQLKALEPRRGRTWHVDEVRLDTGGTIRWLWRAINEHGNVLDVLLQDRRDTEAAVRFFRRLLDHVEGPESIVSDGLGSHGAAMREVQELVAVEHVKVLAKERQNNLVEQSHRPTRDQERQQQGFQDPRRAQGFLTTHARIGNLFARTRARTPACERRHNLRRAFETWSGVSLRVA